MGDSWKAAPERGSQGGGATTPKLYRRTHHQCGELITMTWGFAHDRRAHKHRSLLGPPFPRFPWFLPWSPPSGQEPERVHQGVTRIPLDLNRL